MEFKELLETVVNGKNLPELHAEILMEQIMEGRLTPAQIGGMITALRMKGVTVDEITGLARVMRQKAEKLSDVMPGELVDTCGTGGDGQNTFNVSTATALVVAGAGVKVAKHGNRAVSGKCGSADILEAFGVNINLSPDLVSRCINEVGIGFMFAPLFHKAMHYAVTPRRELGIRTVFNILGPLSNPAGAKRQVVGVFSPDLTEPLAEVLGRLGVEHCYVVHGLDGADEISVCAPTQVSCFQRGELNTFVFHPEEVGIPFYAPRDITGGSVEDNREIILNLLKGKKGAPQDIVVLNAGFVFMAAGKVQQIGEGVMLARDVISSGAAFRKLEEFSEVTRSYAA